MIKRILDFSLAATLTICLAPALAVVGLAIWSSMGRPVLFTQSRPGRNGNIFRMYKFRTMQLSSHPDHSSSTDHDRLTPLGNWLRKTSLDELPELWNVIRGDLSLVGPRPLLVEYLPLYNTRQARRHEVRPGITGWAQVNGRNSISWEEKFELDVWYVEHQSLALDLKILALTFFKVISREGVNSENHATMPPFTGTQNSGPDQEL